MGLQFVIKNVFLVLVTVLLLLLIWNKATDVVREVINDNTLMSVPPSNQMPKETKHEPIHGMIRKMKNNNEQKTTISVSTTTYPEFYSSTADSAKGNKALITATKSVEDVGGHEPDNGNKHTTQQSEADNGVTVTSLAPTAEKELTKYVTQINIQVPSSAATVKNEEQNDVNENNFQEALRQRAEKRHVAFLKVHKTGSSTVQNIFLRFGYSRNLTFILAHDDEKLAETKFPNMISYENTVNDKNIVPPPTGRHFDILCCHVIYNHSQFEKYLPNDTLYIGLVRDPITRLESSIRYFNLYHNVNLSDFAADPLKFDKGLHSMSNNRMAFEFGFPLNLFPNSKDTPINLIQEINDYVAKVMREFKLIMINEKMEESLVLMKRMLSWHVKDIMYIEQLVGKRDSRRFSEKDVGYLKAHLYLDFALYKAALFEFNAKINELGQDFVDEVKLFKDNRDKVYQFCNYKLVGDTQRFEASKWDTGFIITQNDCALYNRHEIKFIQDIRMKQYGRLGI